jgi:ParB family chromosome partitioning protein
MTSIPAVIRDVDERTAAEWALIENIQREDLNPIDRAEGFKCLAEEFGLTHREVAERVGLDRSSVTNHLRLLELDETCQAAVSAGLLSLGHAKALLAITNIDRRRAVAAQALRHGWTVRELERRAQREPRASTPGADAPRTLPAHMRDLEKRLGEHLGTRVRLQGGRRKGTGRLTIEFFSLDEFDGLMRRLEFQPE